MNQLSKEAIEAIRNKNVYCLNSEIAFMEGATESLTNPEIYEKVGLMQTDGLLPESFNNEKVLTLLAISLRHLNAEQLANLLKSITQRSKEATEKAGLISLEDAMGFAEWVADNYQWIPLKKKFVHDDDYDANELEPSSRLFQIYKQQTK